MILLWPNAQCAARAFITGQESIKMRQVDEFAFVKHETLRV